MAQQQPQSPTLKTQEEKKETDFERWQRQQRELAERRERLAEERLRKSQEQEEVDRQEQERLLREEHERQKREQEERQREEFEQRQRAERERLEREREERERIERERREREERERIEREEQERRDRLERTRLEREQREIEERERQEREKQERQKLEKERDLEKQRKDSQAEMNRESDRLRVIERERRMLFSDDTESKKTLDYIEAMSEDEVEREFRRRLEAENKRKSDNQDRRASGLVSVTRVTYLPERNDQSERDRRLQMILQEQKMLAQERNKGGSLRREDNGLRRNEVEGERRLQQLELERKLEEQSILREKENEARRQLQEEQRRRSDLGVGADHVMELKERALRDYERRRGLIDQEIAKQQANLKYQDEIRLTESDEVKSKSDQQKPVSVLKTTNGSKPKKQVSFSQMSTEIREPASPTYVVESSSGYTAKITPAASVRLVETRPPAIHSPPESPLSSPPDSPPESPHDYPPVPRPPPPEYDEYDPPPLPPPPSELLEDDDDFPPPPPPRSPLLERSSNDNYNYSPRNSMPPGYGTYPRASRPMSYPAPADLDSIQLTESLKYSGSNNNIIAMNSGIRQTRSLGRIPAGGGTPPPIPKKPEQLGFKDKMKLFNQNQTPESKVTTSRWQREQYGVNGDITYT